MQCLEVLSFSPTPFHQIHPYCPWALPLILGVHRLHLTVGPFFLDLVFCPSPSTPDFSSSQTQHRVGCLSLSDFKALLCLFSLAPHLTSPVTPQLRVFALIWKLSLCDLYSACAPPPPLPLGLRQFRLSPLYPGGSICHLFPPAFSYSSWHGWLVLSSCLSPLFYRALEVCPISLWQKD